MRAINMMPVVGNVEHGRHAAMLEMPERAYEDCQDKLKNATGKSYQTVMLTSSIGGVPWKQCDPTLMRARSRFKGVRTPRNEWNRRLQTKTSLEQASRTSTSKRDGGICSHHTHDAGKRWSKTKKSGKPTTVSQTDTISKVANKKGFVY